MLSAGITNSIQCCEPLKELLLENNVNFFEDANNANVNDYKFLLEGAEFTFRDENYQIESVNINEQTAVLM